MVKNPSARARVARDVGSIPRLGRCPGGGNGSHPPQYSCLENSTDRGITVCWSQRVRRDWVTEHACTLRNSIEHWFHRAENLWPRVKCKPSTKFCYFLTNVNLHHLHQLITTSQHFHLDYGHKDTLHKNQLKCVKIIKISKTKDWARLQQYVNQELPDVQAGFRKGGGTRDQIANLHWIIEKAREFQKNIYFCFIDYTKAFDCVDHKKLWKILKKMGIPDHLTCLLRNLYAGQEATVRTIHGTKDWFQIGKGVCQGCILSLC